MKEVSSIGRSGGDGQAQDSGGPGLVIHICDMTTDRRFQTAFTGMFLVAGMALFFASFGRYRYDIIKTIVTWLLSGIYLFMGLSALPGIFLIKPIVIQKNGVFFPSHELHALPFIIVPRSVFIEYDKIERIERRFGIHIVTKNGKKYRIPPSVDELDMIEDLIRKGMSSRGQVSLPGPTGQADAHLIFAVSSIPFTSAVRVEFTGVSTPCLLPSSEM